MVNQDPMKTTLDYGTPREAIKTESEDLSIYRETVTVHVSQQEFLDWDPTTLDYAVIGDGIDYAQHRLIESGYQGFVFVGSSYLGGSEGWEYSFAVRKLRHGMCSEDHTPDPSLDYQVCEVCEHVIKDRSGLGAPIEIARDILLNICRQAFVPEDRWHDRDSAGAQRQLGECYALLKAGCRFEVRTDMDAEGGALDKDRTIWVRIWSKGFGYFEVGKLDEETYYLPAQARLDAVAGKDWY